jgi:hypothetical protein
MLVNPHRFFKIAAQAAALCFKPGKCILTPNDWMLASGRFSVLCKTIKTEIYSISSLGILRMDLRVEIWYNEYNEKH